MNSTVQSVVLIGALMTLNRLYVRIVVAGVSTTSGRSDVASSRVAAIAGSSKITLRRVPQVHLGESESVKPTILASRYAWFMRRELDNVISATSRNGDAKSLPVGSCS